MTLNSGLQSLISEALFDFVGHVSTKQKDSNTEVSQKPPDIRDVLFKWADERELDLEEADVQGWAKFTPGEEGLTVLVNEPKTVEPRIAGALASFAEYAALAQSPDLENVLLKWATKTGLEIHDPFA